MSLLQNSNAISSGSYDINNSLRFRSSASAYLSRTLTSSRTTATFSVWVKRGSLGGSQSFFGWTNGVDTSFGFRFASDQLDLFSYTNVFVARRLTNAVYRDPSAWYHIIGVIDTTNATANNRLRVYVNGVEVTSFSASVNPAQNTNLNLGNGSSFGIGADGGSVSSYFDGYLTEINFIDGQALTPSSFGETDAITGVWKPKAYTSTYGTNGFYLKFSDIATTSGSNAGLGKDFSGNSNYWTTNNISVTSGTTYDAMTDSPTNTSATVANYAVLNPVIYSPSTTYSRANLSFTASNTNWTQAVGTIVIPSTGKWYWEVVVGSSIGAGQMHGITATSSTLYSAGSTNWVGWNPLGYAYFNDGTKYNNNAGVAYGNSYTANDIIGIAFDADNGKLFFSKNGTWQASGDPVAGTNAAFTGLTGNSFYPAFSLSTNTGASTADINFGQRPFAYTPPTGFLRLNTYNLPDSTIKKGNTVMDATLWTGTATGAGANTITITNQAGFRPDFVWAKGRSIAYVHGLFNSVCGVNRFLTSNGTQAEAVNEVDGYLTSFNSNGFTLSNGSNSNLTFNTSPSTYVAWQWQAGQGSTSSNTSGSITSTVSVNTTAGFSVVTYTGTGANATVGHGLGVAPKMIIFKQRNAVRGWIVYHASLANASTVIYLNVTNASNTDTTAFNATAPTSSVFSVGTSADTNQSTGTYVAYCWASISGYSAFGSYTGNGSTDGSFVYTGFLPRFVMIKRTDTTGDWYMWDTARNTYDVITNTLLANSSAAETSATSIDALSNGFKLRNTTAGFNANGGTYIYAAFASNPFRNSNAF